MATLVESQRRPDSRSGASASERVCAISMLAALLYVLGLSGWALEREWVVLRLQEAAGSAGAVPGLQALGEIDRRLAICGDGCPARASAAASAAKLALASRAAGAERRRLLGEAEALTRDALRAEPVSAEDWARLALVRHEAEDKRVGRDVLDDLKLSYGAAPFSREASAWRVGFCLRHWGALDRGLRDRALDELVWLGRIDAPLAEKLSHVASDPAAQLAVDLRLRPSDRGSP